MIQFSVTHYKQSAGYALVASSTIVALLFAGFFLAEPAVSYGQTQVQAEQFIITQTITDETSFTVVPADVSAGASISGVTGGVASGTTQFEVTSNNAAGYYVEIAFENNGFGVAMLGDTSASPAIMDYLGDVGGEPSYGYTASTAAQFAYTVESDNAGDTAQSFLNSGTVCNSSGGSQNGATKAAKCWKAPATTAFRIVERSSAAPAGAASTIEFDITVPNAADPAPTADTYTATATLTLFTQ